MGEATARWFKLKRNGRKLCTQAMQCFLYFFSLRTSGAGNTLGIMP